MIEVIEAKKVPTKDIICPNCGSKLRYGNADLHERIDYTIGYGLSHHYFICPVCGVDVTAEWIIKH